MRRSTPQPPQAVAAGSVDVAVIGGGPSGLLIAYTLLQVLKGETVKVYEQAEKYVLSGAAISVAINGLKALEAIDPALEAAVRAGSVDSGGSVAYDLAGRVLLERRVDDAANLTRYGRSRALMGWYELRQALYDMLPPGTVQFGRKFEGYSEDSEGVTAQVGGTSVAARVLIGADGYFSRVRRDCLQGEAPLQFPGAVIWRARLPPLPGLFQGDVVEKAWLGGDRVANMFRLSAHSDDAVWTCSAHRRAFQEAGLDVDEQSVVQGEQAGQQILPLGNTALERCKRLFSDFPAAFRDVVEATDPSTVVEHGIFSRRVDRPWGAGRVTLVGDAAHPVRPSTGQGFSQAAEDAHELALQVQQHGLTPEALRGYEQRRLQRVATISQAEWATAEAAYNRNAEDALAALDEFENSSQYESFKYSLDFPSLQYS